MFKSVFDYSDPPNRFRSACLWASVARLLNHHSTSVAYKNALSAMQGILTEGPTVQTRHHIMGDKEFMMRVPLEYASYQIERGRLGQAIETLEQGRALLWSEMWGVRTPVYHLRRVDPGLADKFLAVSRNLEAIATSIPQPRSPHKDTMTIPDAAGDAFNQMPKELRRLVRERHAIVSQIQAIPCFEHFLKAIPFHSSTRCFWWTNYHYQSLPVAV